MGTTPNRAYPYPDPTSDTRLWEHFEDLADAIDLDVDALADIVGAAWTSYTPVWSAGTSPALGNGTLTGRYRKLGTMVMFDINLTAGTTTTFGTGSWTFSLPPFARTAVINETGACTGLDLSTINWAAGALAYTSPTQCAPILQGATLWGKQVTNLSPWTWATSDQLRMSGRYISA